MKFSKKGKLKHEYSSLFEVLDNKVSITYRLSLLLSLSRVHPMFHISKLKRYHGDGNYIIKWDLILLDKDLIYEEIRL